MDEKGFNLFTALVAIVLVVLAVLLIQTMTGSERKTTDIISDIEEEQKMQTIADLAKADALHAFNFGIRLTIERWLTRDGNPLDPIDADGIPDNRYVLTPEIAAMEWSDIKKDFARSNFGICEETPEGRTCEGRQLATRAANHLTALLERTPDVRGFNIDLDAPQTSELQELLQKVFDKSSEEDDFFQVINCDGTWNGCKNGTFYINLNLKKPVDGGYLEDEEYEKFPQIVISNTVTGSVLKEPILPRGDVQIYVPLRLFKAISGGLEIAKNDGLFESELINGRLDALKVGLCSTGCLPVTNPYLDSVFFEGARNFACVGDNITGSTIDSVPLDGGINGTYSYDPSDTGKMNSKLKEFAEKELLNPALNQLASERLTETDPTFKLVSTVNDNAASSANAIVLSVPSRRIQTTSLGESTAFCSKVNRVEAILVFEDSNENYIVSNVSPTQTNRYAIRFIDTTYSEFSPPMPDGSLKLCRTVSNSLGSGFINSFSCEEG